MPFPKFILTCILILIFSGNAFAQTDLLSLEVEYDINEVNYIFKDGKAFEEDFLNSLTKSASGEIYSESEFALDVLRIQKFYFDNGYFDCTVDTSTTIIEDGEEIDLYFYIYQNNPYRIYSVNVEGLENVPQNIKDKIFRTSEYQLTINSIYTKAKVELEAVRIINILTSNGYAYAKRENTEVVKNISESTLLKNTINLNLSFETGEQYYFGTTDVVIKKNVYGISETDFIREIQYKEGQLYDRNLIARTESRLSAISITETNNLVVTEIDSANRVLNYTLEITLRNKYELTPEVVGYNIRSRFYGGLGLSYVNRYFFNTNRTFGARVRGLLNSFEDIRLEFLAQISQPYLFDNERITGTLGLGFDYLNEPGFEIQQYRTRLGLTFDLPEYTYINKAFLNWTFEYTDLVFAAEPLDSLQQETGLIDIGFNYFNSRIGVDAVHDNTNSLSFPTHGYFQSLSLEETGLLGSLLLNLFDFNTFKFVKLINLNKFFFNLSSEINSKAALGTKFLIGNIFPYGDPLFTVNGETFVTDDVPFDDRFTGGGANSNRGWRARTLGMLRKPEDGGNFVLEGSIEHRTRPFIESDNFILKEIGFVTFMDFGNIWETASKFKFDQIALSLGGGVRYYTLVGAVRFDVGFKIYDPNPGTVGVTKWIWQPGANFNDKYSIHIALGNSF